MVTAVTRPGFSVGGSSKIGLAMICGRVVRMGPQNRERVVLGTAMEARGVGPPDKREYRCEKHSVGPTMSSVPSYHPLVPLTGDLRNGHDPDSDTSY